MKRGNWSKDNFPIICLRFALKKEGRWNLHLWPGWPALTDLSSWETAHGIRQTQNQETNNCDRTLLNSGYHSCLYSLDTGFKPHPFGYFYSDFRAFFKLSSGKFRGSRWPFTEQWLLSVTLPLLNRSKSPQFAYSVSVNLFCICRFRRSDYEMNVTIYIRV
jgi:hypothetical protein